MRVWVTLLIAGLIPFAGCIAEDAEPVDDVVIEDVEEHAQHVELMVLEGLTLSAEALNGTAPYFSNFTLAAEIEDANATWTVTYLFTDFASEDANATENATASSDDNETADAGSDAILLLEGTGLPAMFNATFETPGMYALTAVVALDGYEPAEATIDVEAFEAAVEENVQQEPLVFTGTLTGHPEAGDEETLEFELTSAPVRITAVLEQGATAIDVDWDMFTPSGTNAAHAASFECAPVLGSGSCNEEPLIVENAKHLAEQGLWTIVLDPYLAGNASYTVTVTFEY